MKGPVPDLIDQLISDWKRTRPQTEPAAMQIVGRVVRLGRNYDEAASRLVRSQGLSYSDFDVLATLRRMGEPYALSPTELQMNVLLTSGAMTACLRRLERRKLVSRTGDPQDRRRLAANLTPAGFDLVEGLIDARFELAKRSIADLSAGELHQLEALLRKLEASG